MHDTDVKPEARKNPDLMEDLLDILASKLVEVVFNPVNRKKLLEILKKAEEKYSKPTPYWILNFLLEPALRISRQRGGDIAELESQLQAINKKEETSNKLNESLAVFKAESNRDLQAALEGFFFRGNWESTSVNTNFAVFFIETATNYKFEQLYMYSDKPHVIIHSLCQRMLAKFTPHVQENFAVAKKAHLEKQIKNQKLAEARSLQEKQKEAEAAKKLDVTVPENFDFARKQNILVRMQEKRKRKEQGGGKEVHEDDKEGVVKYYEAPERASYKKNEKLEKIALVLENFVGQKVILQKKREAAEHNAKILERFRQSHQKNIENRIEKTSLGFRSSRQILQTLLGSDEHQETQKKVKSTIDAAVEDAESFVDVENLTGEGYDFFTTRPAKTVLAIDNYEPIQAQKNSLPITTEQTEVKAPVKKSEPSTINRLVSLSASVPLFGITPFELDILKDEAKKQGKLSKSAHVTSISRKI